MAVSRCSIDPKRSVSFLELRDQDSFDSESALSSEIRNRSASKGRSEGRVEDDKVSQKQVIFRYRDEDGVEKGEKET